MCPHSFHLIACVHWIWFSFLSISFLYHPSCIFAPPLTSHVQTSCSLTLMFPITDHFLTSLLQISLWMNEWMNAMNAWTNSPNETLSLDAPFRESLSPSPSLPLGPRSQTKESQEKLDKDEGDQAGSVPCYEIHATGLRRCSEPLPYNLPPPPAEPPMKMFAHLMVSSEQRSLSCCVFLQILN